MMIVTHILYKEVTPSQWACLRYGDTTQETADYIINKEKLITTFTF